MQFEEIICAPFTVWFAPVGTAFPSINAGPQSPWSMVGTNGPMNYSEEGVSARHSYRNETSQPAANQAPSHSFIGGEEYRVRIQLLDMTLEQYALALGGNPVTVSGGLKVMGLSRRPRAEAPLALLVRGPSAYDETKSTQFEIPIARQAVAGPQTVFRRGQPVGIAVEFLAVENPAAPSADQLFGRVLSQT